MNKKIMQGVIIAGIIAFLISTFVMYIGVSRYTNRQLLAAMEQETEILSTVMDAAGQEGLEAYINNAAENTGDAAAERHVVWLKADGSVIMDSAATGEDYSVREEFIDALELGSADENYGVDSFTGMVISLATVMSDGTVLIIEASAPTVTNIIEKTGGTLAIAIILFIIVLAIGGNLICRKIVNDLNNLDPNKKKHVDYFYDLRPMTDKMGLVPPAVITDKENANK